MSRYYILVGDEPMPVSDLAEWGAWFEKNHDARVVAKTDVADAAVSTVFLATDHQWGSGPPLLFETMIFGGKWDQYQWRYTTRVQAQASHDRIVAALQAGEAPEGEER